MKNFICSIVVVFLIVLILPTAIFAAPTVKSSSTSYQYGAAAFDPTNTYSQYDDLYIFEKGDYTLVYWVEDTPTTKMYVYMSVAKKDKWLFRGKKVLELKDRMYSSSGTQYSFANNTIFSQSDGVVKASVINMDTGAIKVEKILGKVEQEVSPFQLIQTNDRYGLLMPSDAAGIYNIFIEGELSKPVQIQDPRFVLNKQFYGFPNIILTAKRDRLILMNNLYSKVYNINSKDMVYDNKGEEKTIQFGKKGTGLRFYANGKLFVYYDHTSLIETYDDNFKLVGSVQIKPNEDINMFSPMVTLNNNKIRFWSFNSFKNTTSLKVVTYNLGK